ncbi:MAG: hypothetical protein HY360_13635 [Verrucomicrobia bacterium]|nr:hypothetical protein [Verrucomicrobiota bacterium]
MDGIIAEEQPSEMLLELSRQVQVVLLNQSAEGMLLSAVIADMETAARQQIQYLHEFACLPDGVTDLFLLIMSRVIAVMSAENDCAGKFGVTEFAMRPFPPETRTNPVRSRSATRWRILRGIKQNTTTRSGLPRPRAVSATPFLSCHASGCVTSKSGLANEG